MVVTGVCTRPNLGHIPTTDIDPGDRHASDSGLRDLGQFLRRPTIGLLELTEPAVEIGLQRAGTRIAKIVHDHLGRRIALPDGPLCAPHGRGRRRLEPRGWRSHRDTAECLACRRGR